MGSAVCISECAYVSGYLSAAPFVVGVDAILWSFINGVQSMIASGYLLVQPCTYTSFVYQYDVCIAQSVKFIAASSLEPGGA